MQWEAEESACWEEDWRSWASEMLRADVEESEWRSAMIPRGEETEREVMEGRE
jgi:hypothetical protein